MKMNEIREGTVVEGPFWPEAVEIKRVSMVVEHLHKKGEMTISEYEDKIQEPISQAKLTVEEETKE